MDDLLSDGPVDLVCFTGDAADWGSPEEFTSASEFFAELLAKLRLGNDRLFVVPGNHDVTRPVETEAWLSMRSLLESTTDRLTIARWIGGGASPFGVSEDLRDRVLRRLSAYSDWVKNGLKRPDLVPREGRLGFSSQLDLGLGYSVNIIGLNTSWMCGDESDSGRLWALDDQVMQLVCDEQGAALPGIRIVLMHHPFVQLADGSQCRRLMAEWVDLVLRGHLHETDVETWSDPTCNIRELAVGSLYEGGRADYWPNSCQLLSLKTDVLGNLSAVDVRFRTWSSRGGHWHDDEGLYSQSKNGHLNWTQRRSPLRLGDKLPTQPNPFDPWNPVIPPSFVGRVNLLARLKVAFDEGRSTSLVGDWRIGKSSLLRTCMTQLEHSGRVAKLLSGEGHEGASPAAFVECVTGLRPENSADAAADALSGWAHQVCQSGSLPVLIVDEFDALINRFDSRFFERLRGMLDRMSLLVCSRRELDRVFQDLSRTSPFHNRLELHWLGLLEVEAAEELINRSRGLLAEDVRAALNEWAGPHPFFIQLFGRKLVDCSRYGADLDQAKEEFLTEATSRLRELWDTLTQKEKQILRLALNSPQPRARSLRQRGLLNDRGELFARVLIEWLHENVE